MFPNLRIWFKGWIFVNSYTLYFNTLRVLLKSILNLISSGLITLVFVILIVSVFTFVYIGNTGTESHTDEDLVKTT